MKIVHWALVSGNGNWFRVRWQSLRQVTLASDGRSTFRFTLVPRIDLWSCFNEMR